MPVVMNVDYSKCLSSLISPLDTVRVRVRGPVPKSWRITVADGRGAQYVNEPARAIRGNVFAFVACGALGEHVISLGAAGKEPRCTARFVLDARTSFRTSTGRIQRFYDIMESEIFPEVSGAAESTRMYCDGKIVRFYVHWMRDDTHNKKAFKYWEQDVKSLPETFLDMQKPGGMVYDLFNYPIEHGYYTRRYTWGDEFTGFSKDGRIGWCRIPVEADVEYLTVESVYVSWQASGDDRWMERMLPKLEKAMRYMMTDSKRWSKEHELVKRGFTIDTWDFQHRAAFANRPGGGKNLLGWPDYMWIDEGTPWCIMHGDNSGMYQACRQMAAMHRYLGRKAAAKAWDAKADAFRANTDKVCWNGSFYTHQVHLDPIEGDFGVDEARQLSLSNPYDMTRGLPDHTKCVSIIREYQRRREETKSWSFAEWFTIHPFFGDKFGGHLELGQYMNGSVTTIVAGELARAAFWHGFEDYGADIINRLIDLQKRDGHLHVSYHPSGRQLDWIEATYTPLPLDSAANRAFDGTKPGGWTGEGDNDLHECPTGRQTFLDVPFDIADPATNNGNSCLILRGGPLGDLPQSASVPANGATAQSVYVLHTINWARAAEPCANYAIEYTDGTEHLQCLVMGQHITGWWAPHNTRHSRAVFHGKNRMCGDVGFNIFGFANPHPGKRIKAVRFESSGNGAPIIIGVTLSSGPVQYPCGNVSYGIPDNWGSAAVMAALVEGLAGVTDNVRTFDDVTIAPRWCAAGEREARAVVRYGASNGYVAYTYKLARTSIVVSFTGSGGVFRFHVMLPPGKCAKAVTAGGSPVPFEHTVVERTPYADFRIEGAARGEITVAF
ncbi:hypothetical protein GX586_09735 [bacterium]|nr:hypothetical protein [bacterium]